MNKEYEIMKTASGKMMKVFPIIECFDKTTEQLVKEISLHVTDMDDLRYWLIQNFSWGKEQPLIEGVDLDSKTYSQMIKFIDPKRLPSLDFSKYGYQLSFEYLPFDGTS